MISLKKIVDELTDYWTDMSTDAQKSYLKNHPDSPKTIEPDNPSGKKERGSEQEKDNWEKIDSKEGKYKAIRDYSDEEYQEEVGEYFENDVTMKTAPNAFKDKSDMLNKMKTAKPIYLSSEKMEFMSNTNVGEILNSDNPKQAAAKVAAEVGRDISWQYKSIENNNKVPAPMALRDKNDEYWLLAGNTRLMAFTAAGKKLPIKVIDYEGTFNYD